MTYQGCIKNGAIILNGAPHYPDGTAVVVEVIAVNTPSLSGEKDIETIYDRWQGFIGIAEGLPEDFAKNHDHYAHGRPLQ